jgi:hypothetical protein
MSIDVSKLKKGDRCRSTKKWWRVVDRVVDVGDSYQIYDENGFALTCFADGCDVDGDTAWDIIEVDIEGQSAVIKSDGGVIDVSKLRPDDWYYTPANGWKTVYSVKFQDGYHQVYNTEGYVLRTYLDGTNHSANPDYAITEVKTREQVQQEMGVSRKTVVSDGGSSSYYTFPKGMVDRVASTGKLETQDIITHGFGNDFDFGNAFKSLKRLYEIKCGGGKEGNTPEYEVNKIKYSLDKILEGLK